MTTHRAVRPSAFVFAILIAVTPLALPSSARADHEIRTPFHGTRPFQLDLHGGLAWYGFGFVGGARFGIPILHNGFVPSLDNAVYINFGIDNYFVDDHWCYDYNPADCQTYRGYRYALGFPVTLHWEFYFNDTWSAFAEVGFQIYLPPSLFYRGYIEYYDHAGAWFVGAVGGTVHLGDIVGLTLRVGNPYISFGVTLNLG